jgi:DDE family transposase
LWYFLSPIVTSLRGVPQATTWAPVHARCGLRPTALGTLSDAAQVCDAARRQEVIAAWGRRLPPPAVATARAALQALTAVDGSLWPARPQRAWAWWQDAQHRAAKRHVAFEVCRQIPVGLTGTAGQASERVAWRRLVPPGGFDVVERGSSDDARFQERRDWPYPCRARVPHHAAYEVPEERSLSAAAQTAGVRRDGLIRRLGTAHHTRLRPPPCRVVLVASGKTQTDGSPDLLVLVTHPLDLEAAWVALASRWRWAGERLFRWLTCGLGCRHRLSQSANGVRMQVSVAIMASLLISLWVGRPPTKRTYDMLCFDLSGWASAAAVIAHLDRLPFRSPPPGKT